MLNKDKGRGQHKNPSKSRRAYIAWESDNDSSSDSEESTNVCLSAYYREKKKKNVSHCKYEHVDKLSYSELQVTFENLHREAVDAFKMLA